MARTCPRIIALIAIVTCSQLAAQAADTALTLACQGAAASGVEEDAKPEPVSMGIIVNFTKQTVHGFGFPGMDYPVNITGANEVTVVFAGRREDKFSTASIMGSIDRVTGDVEDLDEV